MAGIVDVKALFDKLSEFKFVKVPNRGSMVPVRLLLDKSSRERFFVADIHICFVHLVGTT